jgi:F-type H+-transporting ATPase subunit epsilon
MTLKIISAEQIEFEGTVEQVTLPGVMGMFQVLKNHAALIAALKEGTMSYVVDDGSTVEREIHGGVADVKDNVVSVCLY